MKNIFALIALVSVISQGHNVLAQIPQGGYGGALNSPDCIKAAEDKVDLPGDEMLVVNRKGEVCAYPLRMMTYHRIVNDHLGGLILVTYDPDTGIGRMFDRQIDGKEIFFDAAPGKKLSPRMKDRGTGSIWSPLTGEAISGSLKGKKLELVPSFVVTWGRWKEMHPDSYVLKLDDKSKSNYLPWSKYKGDNITIRYTLEFPEIKPIQERMKLNWIVGANQFGKPFAFYLPTKKLITINIISAIAFHDPAAHSTVLYEPVVDGKPLTFKVDPAMPAAPFVDAETNSHFALDGFAVDGPLKGKQLKWVDSLRMRGYAWQAAYPKVKIVYVSK